MQCLNKNCDGQYEPICTKCEMPKWINVKDRLPNENEDVLVWDGNLNLDNIPTYEIASYRFFKNGNKFICGPYSLQNITHWMPLPEPPKE